MEVAGNKGESDEADAIEPLAAGEGTDDDLIQRVAGPQEQTAVNAPAGHLHQRSSVRDKAQKSGHALYKRKNGRSSDTLVRISSPASASRPIRAPLSGSGAPCSGRRSDKIAAMRLAVLSVAALFV